MMRYWPISVVRNSLYPDAARILDAALETRQLSAEIYHTCTLACSFAPAVYLRELVLVKDDSPLPKHAFLGRPPTSELWHLERTCVCENFDGEIFLMISSLH